MGYDYSGGGLGGPNRHMAAAIHALRTGQTRGQQNQAMADKAVLALTQAGLTTLAGGLSAHGSNQLQAKQAQEHETERYNKLDAEINPKAEGTVPAWLGEHGEGQQGYQMPKDDGMDMVNMALPGEAQAAIDRQKNNVAAQGVAIGGYHTPEGAEATSMAAGQQARDMGTGKDMMKFGGMMNSLPRVPR